MAVLYLKVVKFSKPPASRICKLTGSGEGTMEASYFYMLILPLGLIVAGLVAAVYYYANREEIAKKKTKKLVQAYIKERAKRKAAMNKELAKIDRLFEEESIDEETCERLKNVLIVMNTRESEDASGLLEYVKSGK
jgi:hypothetical protein